MTDLVTDLEKGPRRREHPGRGHRGRGRPSEVAPAGQGPGHAVRRPDRRPVPSTRAIGDLLIELRKAGASAIAAPVCGEQLRTLQRKGQDWYCSVCGQERTERTTCGNVRRLGFQDRKGLPRCKMCPDTDDREAAAVAPELITAIAPGVDRDAVAEALRRSAPHRPRYRQRVVWALEENPSVLTGEGCLAPHRAIQRFVDLLHETGVTGIVRPACPRCHRVVHIDKPLDGQRVCRNCIAKSRFEEYVRCGARREPATRDAEGRPLCPSCLVRDPANLETCIICGESRMVNSRTAEGPNCRPLTILLCSICGVPHPACSRSSPACPAAAAVTGAKLTAPSADECAASTRAPPAPPSAAPAPRRTPSSGAPVPPADKPNGCTNRGRAPAVPSSSGSTNSSPMTPAP